MLPCNGMSQRELQYLFERLKQCVSTGKLKHRGRSVTGVAVDDWQALCNDLRVRLSNLTSRAHRDPTPSEIKTLLRNCVPSVWRNNARADEHSATATALARQMRISQQ